MRTVVGVALVGLFVVAACGGSSNGNEPRANGGTGPTSGTSGNVGGSSAGNVSGGISAGGQVNTGGQVNLAGSSAVAGGAGHHSGGAPLGGGPAEGGAGGDGSTEGGAAGAAGFGGEDSGPNGPVIECDCLASEACIKVTVTRDANTTKQPWILWPTQTDGIGTLTVSAATPSQAAQDKVTVPQVSLVAASAVQGVALCVPAGATSVHAFLDEEELEHPNAVSSSDYLDSCAPGAGQCFRCYDVTTTAGSAVNLAIALKQTCD